MAIKTRQTTADGVTNKDAPLTNDELDNNFVELVQGKASLSGATFTGDVTIDNNSTTGAIKIQSGDTTTGFNNRVQVAFGYSETDDYQHFIQTRHNAGGYAGNGIDIKLCDTTQNNTWISGSRYAFSLDGGDLTLYDTSGTAKFRWDASEQRLGVGTASPSVPLEVNVSGAGDVFKLTRDTGTNGELSIDFSGANANFNSEQGGYNFETSAATNVLVLTSAGYVGINTVSPSTRLDVNGAATVGRLIVGTNTVSTTSDIALSANVSTNGENSWSFGLTEADAYYRWLFGCTSYTGGTSGGTEHMRLDEDGLKISERLLNSEGARLHNEPASGLRGTGMNMTNAGAVDTGHNFSDANSRGIVWTGKHYIIVSYNSPTNTGSFHFYNSDLTAGKWSTGNTALQHNLTNLFFPHGAAWDGRYLAVIGRTTSGGSGDNVYIFDVDDLTSGYATLVAQVNLTTDISVTSGLAGIGYAEGLYWVFSNGGNLYGFTIDLATQKATSVVTKTGLTSQYSYQFITYDGSHLYGGYNGSPIYKHALDGSQVASVSTGVIPDCTALTWNGQEFIGIDYNSLDIYAIPVTHETYSDYLHYGATKIVPKGLDKSAFEVTRWNQDYPLIEFGENDGLGWGSAGSYGASVIHAYNRPIAITTQNAEFPSLSTTPALFIAEDNGNVGINTASPDVPLEIYNPDAGSGNELYDPSFKISTNVSGVENYLGLSPSQIRYRRETVTGVPLRIQTYVPASSTGGYISFEPNSDSTDYTPVSRMVITKEGYVGINTESPTNPLHVRMASDGNVAQFDSVSGPRLYLQSGASSFDIIGGNSSGGAGPLKIRPSGVASSFEMATDGDITIDRNVYIDTNSGSTKFYVTRSGSSDQGLSIWADDVNLYLDYVEDSGESGRGTIHFRNYRNGDTATTWLLNDTNLNSTFYGDLTIQTSSPVINLKNTASSVNSRSSYLRWTDSDSTENAYVGFGSSSNDNFIISQAMAADMLFYVNGSARLTINSGGDATFSGEVTVNSDERIKDNIEQIDGALEKVQAIRGVSFTRNDTEDDRRHVGVIAQEVEKVLPEVVTENEETGIKSVAYANMVGLLIEAIKEQQTQIDDLKAEVTRLKGFD